MCYCTPSIRTPFCHNCNQYMRTEIETLRARVAELEKTADALATDFHNSVCSANRLSEQLAAVTKENDCLRELAKWREKYSLTGSPEIYDNPSQEFHKWVCETHNTLKVGAGETAETCMWWEGVDDEDWATQCNHLFHFEDADYGPDKHNMKFCCFCGKKLIEVLAESEEEDV